MSMYFKQIQDSLSDKQKEVSTIAGVVKSASQNKFLVLLQDGRTRNCWGNAKVGDSVIVQNEQIIGIGKVGTIKTYHV